MDKINETDHYELLNRILRSSKRYEMDGSILTLTHYHTGEPLKLDLSLLDPETVEAIAIKEDCYE